MSTENNDVNDDDRAMAAQLSNPEGERGKELASDMNRANALVTACTIDCLIPDAGQNIVEIGPGNGMLSFSLTYTLEGEGHYQAIERSADMALQVRDNLAEYAECKITVHNEDCFDAPIEEGSIDGIFGVNVIYFIEDMVELFTLFDRWLKPGGRVALGIRTSDTMKAQSFTQHGFKLREKEEIEAAMTTVGWRLAGSEYFEEPDVECHGKTMKVDALVLSAQKM